MAKKNKKKQNPLSERPSRTLSINIEYGNDGIDTVSVVADGDSWAHSKLRGPLNKLAATVVALLADAGEPGTLSELLRADFALPKMDPTQAKTLVKSFLSQVDVSAPESEPVSEPEPECCPKCGSRIHGTLAGAWSCEGDGCFAHNDTTPEN